LREAVRHPRLDGPVAFLGDIEVVPLLRLAIATDPLPPGQWLALWSRVLPAATAMRLLLWLLRPDVLTPGAIGGSCCPGGCGGERGRGECAWMAVFSESRSAT